MVWCYEEIRQVVLFSRQAHIEELLYNCCSQPQTHRPSNGVGCLHIFVIIITTCYKRAELRLFALPLCTLYVDTVLFGYSAIFNGNRTYLLASYTGRTVLVVSRPHGFG